MSYDGKIMARALARFDEDKQRRAQQFRQRREELYRRAPRLEEIDRQLRSTLPRIIASALDRGADPLPAIRVLRDENLSLQRERETLLTGMGYDPHALEETPNCPLCRDTGYRGSDVCRCLQEYYAREQIAELSRLLPMGTQTFDTFSFDWYGEEKNGLPYSPRETAEHNFDVCRDYAYQFSPRSGNLLLFGPPGLGKTFLSACIARVVSENGHSVVYDTAGHIFARMEDAKFRRDEEDDSQEYEYAPNPMRRSCLYFAGANDWLLTGQKDPVLGNGILTAEELCHYRMAPPDLVVLSACFSVRSALGSQKEALKDRLACFMEALGGRAAFSGDYPAWEYREHSPLRERMVQVFREQYGRDPKIEAIHAGVECGLLADKLPGLDCVSIGPDLLDIHTPRERMSVPSVQRTWRLLLEVLRRSRV